MIWSADTVKYKYGSFLIFFEMYTSHESWINKSEIQLLENLRVYKNLNIEKIIFKVVQMKFLAMHNTNQKYVLMYLQ